MSEDDEDRSIYLVTNSYSDPELVTMVKLQGLTREGVGIPAQHQRSRRSTDWLGACRQAEGEAAPPRYLAWRGHPQGRHQARPSNKGGTIMLLNDRGLKVPGVSYTREQANQPGWTIAF